MNIGFNLPFSLYLMLMFLYEKTLGWDNIPTPLDLQTEHLSCPKRLKIEMLPLENFY